MNAAILIEKGENADERKTTPNMSVKLDRFEPIAFAVAKRILPRFKAVRLRLSSGKLVPIDTSLAPMNIGITPKSPAISNAEDTVN